ncbi:ABC transporter permease subunit [Bradyrhizobium betae]|uniref:Branched-chain amino acid ABC transporter permease n=1 Tax=Bradyrhizobium betae TaxID=244734 RepID=A0A4Q1VNP8_9BRAD|nr:branched-chain amino acid ABC transporter permease [Bradyrhizobium betae]RXT54208.1 branched-chain amino acid ABC transporter permease [Bradyrhizobium betae]
MHPFVRSNASLIAVGVIGIALLVGLPLALELFTLLRVTLFVIFAILALSLAFIWGYGGILCFGHSAFFGLGAYAYAVSVINVGDSTLPIVIAMALPALLAAALGYFMFYARISDVYVGVITLTVTLIFYNVVNSTAGPQYRIGDVHLGGFNGIPNVPSLNVPFDPNAVLGPQDMFWVCMVALMLVYFGLRMLLRMRFGRVLIAVRENESRVEFLGYDARLHKLIAFSIGGAIAGLAGCLFTAWGGFISPTAFSVVQSAQIIIWLMVGGVGTLIGPMIGAALISWLTASLGSQQTVDANVVLGTVLLAFVLLVPKGIAPIVTDQLMPWFLSMCRSKPSVASVSRKDKT